MNRLFTLLLAALLMLVSGCVMPKEISNALYDREVDELLQNTAAEYIVHASVGSDEASPLNKHCGQVIKEQMQRLEAQLEAMLGGNKVATLRQPDEGILLVIPSDYMFKSGLNELKAGMFQYIEIFQAILAQFPDFQTYILVHTDNNGSEYLSLALSEERAKVLRKELKKAGMKKLHAEGKGALVPIITNESEEGRRLNRRVEIAIVATPKMIRQTRKSILKNIKQSKYQDYE